MADDQAKVLIHLIDKAFPFLSTVAYCTCLAVIAYFAADAVKALAGQNTAVLVSYLTSSGSGVTVTVSLSFGVLGGIYGWRQRNLRRSAIESLAPRLAELERLVDPDRSSSGLTMQGTTNPEDI